MLAMSKKDWEQDYEKYEITWREKSDGLGTLGKGRLTDKITNKMQNYYDMAIRQNTLSQNNDEEKALHSIKKSVWHCTDMPDNQERHAVCPREANSWCKY